MKIISFILLILAGISILGYGTIYWQEQITEMTDSSQVVEQPIANDSVEGIEFNLDDANNLPEEVRDRLVAVHEQGEVVDLVLIGRNEGDWAQGLKEAIITAYGSQIWNIEILSYGERTSPDLAQDATFQNLRADVILYEVPLLNNNLEGVLYEVTVSETESLLKAWNEAVVIFQPSNPIFQGQHYPEQVRLFRDEYMAIYEYLYLDHWLSWPDINSEAMLDYLIADDNERYHINEAGATLWTEILSHYFIAR